MKPDDLIRLAMEADVWIVWKPPYQDQLEKFAAAIEADLRRQGYRRCAEGQAVTQYCALLEAAVQAEREACTRGEQ